MKLTTDMTIKFILPALALATAWGIIQTRVDTFEERLMKVENKMEQLDQTFLKIEVRLAEIQKDIQAINSKLDKGE